MKETEPLAEDSPARSALDRALTGLMGKMTADRQERRNVFWRTASMVLTGGAAALYGAQAFGQASGRHSVAWTSSSARLKIK